MVQGKVRESYGLNPFFFRVRFLSKELSDKLTAKTS